MDRVQTITLLCLLLAPAICHAADQQQRSGRARDSEGSAFSFMPEYVQWVNKSCGTPQAADNKSADCKALKDKMCGTRMTSEVLCMLTNVDSGDPIASFRSASRYTRVTYLTCSLTQLKCVSSPETYDPPVREVSPVSIAAWVTYTDKCTVLYEGKAKPDPTECAKLAGVLCSRPDVRCSKGSTEFLVPGTKDVLLRGDNSRGLAFLV